MSLFLDSAMAADARQAMALGFIKGITTNPTLLAKAGGKPENVIAELADICDGPVFYQLNAPPLAGREEEARRILALRPNIGLKIAMTTQNLALAAKFAQEGVVVGMTASYSAAQTYLACESGVDYSIAYVNRSTRFQGDGVALVKSNARRGGSLRHADDHLGCQPEVGQRSGAGSSRWGAPCHHPAAPATGNGRPSVV